MNKSSRISPHEVLRGDWLIQSIIYQFKGDGGGLIYFLLLKREGLLEGGGLFERVEVGGGGGLIEDLWYLLFFKLFTVNIQDDPWKEKIADSEISGYV